MQILIMFSDQDDVFTYVHTIMSKYEVAVNMLPRHNLSTNYVITPDTPILGVVYAYRYALNHEIQTIVALYPKVFLLIHRDDPLRTQRSVGGKGLFNPPYRTFIIPWDTECDDLDRSLIAYFQLG